MDSSFTARRNRFAGARGRGRASAAWLAAALLLASGAHGMPGPPTDAIRGATDRLIAILNDPALAKKPAERRDLLRKEIEPVFDFGEMSKRSLGANWRDRTPAERAEFVALFTRLLENSYLGKVESYKGEKIRYVRESGDPPYAQVDTLIVTTRQQEIPVNYRMLREGDRWRVYDVLIEGVSLVNNYRAQFASVLAKSPFEELIRKLRTTAAGPGRG